MTTNPSNPEQKPDVRFGNRVKGAKGVIEHSAVAFVETAELAIGLLGIILAPERFHAYALKVMEKVSEELRLVAENARSVLSGKEPPTKKN